MHLANIIAAPAGLAVDRNDVGRSLAKRRTKSFAKALQKTRKRHGINRAEQTRERIVARGTVGQVEELPQEFLLRAPEQSHARATLRAARNCARCDKHHVAEIMPRILGAAQKLPVKDRASSPWPPPYKRLSKIPFPNQCNVKTQTKMRCACHLGKRGFRGVCSKHGSARAPRRLPHSRCRNRPSSEYAPAGRG